MSIFINILTTIGLIFVVIVIFNLMIVVHEWGHFLAARWRGLVIDKFYIWFGKPIWKKTINGVEYGLGSIPFGGFVALPQMAPMDRIEGGGSQGRDLPPIKPLDKIIVAFAGPLFSFLLAFSFALIIWLVGEPQRSNQSTVIGFVQKDSPAENAGFQLGDKILTIEGKTTKKWAASIDSVISEIIFSRGDSIDFTIEREGKILPIQSKFIVPATSALERSGTRQVGIGQAEIVEVGSVLKGSPAEHIGLMPGDQILAYKDSDSNQWQKVWSRQHFAQISGENKEKKVILQVASAKEKGKESVLKEIAIVPAVPENYRGKADERAMVGIQWGGETAPEVIRPGPNPFRQIATGARMIVQNLGALLSPDSDIGFSHFQGPIGIGNIYYQAITQPEWGLLIVIWFSVLLNVNLGLLNLLPLPVLDGGHITLGFFEMLRGKPLNFRFLEYIQTGFALLLFSFMIYVTVFDAGDVWRNNAPRTEETEMPLWNQEEIQKLHQPE